MKIPRLLLWLVVALSAALRLCADTPVGQFAQHADIGAPAITGLDDLRSSLQTYRMSAGGINLWGTSDQFQFAWNKVKGDFIRPRPLRVRRPGRRSAP